MVDDYTVREQNLLNLAKNGGFKFTDKFFLYTSGKIGPYFVQSIDICKNGADYAWAIDSMKNLILHEIGNCEFDVISGGESRDWDFSNPVAVALQKPHTKLYKDKDPIGASIRDKIVLHVADLNNEGSSPRDLWVPQIKKQGGHIFDIVFFVDRNEEGTNVVKELGLESHAVITLNKDAWQILLDKNYVTLQVYNS